MIAKAMSFGGWPGFLLLVTGNAVGLLAWFACVATRRYRGALYVTIAMFPFSFYAGRAAGIRAFSVPDFDQFIGLSTALVLSLFLILAATGRIRRSTGVVPTTVEGLLWLFAVLLTVSQFQTHQPRDAALLSIGAVWQYVALYYILSSLIRRDEDALGLLNATFAFSMFNILVRVVAKGERLIVPLSSPTAGDGFQYGAEAGRVGSGAMGLAVSYAGYLAVLITLVVGVYLFERRKIHLAVVAVLFVELLNTFTRGGLIVLALLALLVFVKRTRGNLLRVGFLMLVPVVVFWPLLRAYLGLRAFSLNLMEVGNFSTRVELTRMFFEDYHLDWWGNGILRPTMFEVRPWLVVPVHNAYLEILDVCGVLAFGAFVMLSLVLVAGAMVAVIGTRRVDEAPSFFAAIAPFLLIALLQWIVFANTTSTSVLAYYPYEATALFWIVAFLPLLDPRRQSPNPESTAVSNCSSESDMVEME